MNGAIQIFGGLILGHFMDFIKDKLLLSKLGYKSYRRRVIVIKKLRYKMNILVFTFFQVRFCTVEAVLRKHLGMPDQKDYDQLR